MSVAVFKTFSAGEVLTAADLNASFTQLTDNGEDLGWPATKAKDLNGFELIFDSDADSSLTVDTDDRLDVRLRGTDLFRFDGATGGTTVDGLDFIAAAAASPVYIIPQGATANVDLELRSKGSGDVVLADDSGNEILVAADVASAINEITVTNAAAGNEPIISATGGDTDISITLTPKGTGGVDVSSGPLTITSGALNMTSGALNMTAGDLTLSEGNIELIDTNTAASIGPLIKLNRNSGSPAVDDELGEIRFSGESSTSVEREYAEIKAAIITTTNGSEDGKLNFGTIVGGTNGLRLIVANGVYTPGATSGDQGANTINAADYYRDGVQLLPIVQVVNSTDGAVSVGTTVMVYDDSIPQNTEGDEVMTATITPTNSSNKLLIEVTVHAGHSAGVLYMAALFQDSTAGALAAASANGTTDMQAITFQHIMAAGTTSATTFKVRLGNSSGGNTAFNGSNAGGRIFGGVASSTITITEISQ